jgi:hypothetical protein
MLYGDSRPSRLSDQGPFVRPGAHPNTHTASSKDLLAGLHLFSLDQQR